MPSIEEKGRRCPATSAERSPSRAAWPRRCRRCSRSGWPTRHVMSRSERFGSCAAFACPGPGTWPWQGPCTLGRCSTSPSSPTTLVAWARRAPRRPCRSSWQPSTPSWSPPRTHRSGDSSSTPMQPRHGDALRKSRAALPADCSREGCRPPAATSRSDRSRSIGRVIFSPLELGDADRRGGLDGHAIPRTRHRCPLVDADTSGVARRAPVVDAPGTTTDVQGKMTRPSSIGDSMARFAPIFRTVCV